MAVEALKSKDLTEQFEESGYVILRGVLPASVIDTVRREIEAIVDEHVAKLIREGRLDDPKAGVPLERRLIEVVGDRPDRALGTLRRELHRPGFYDLFFRAEILDIVEEFLGEEIRLYPNYSVRPKLPEDEATLVLWHQDAGYTEQSEAVNELRMVNLWTPFVPARIETGCMEFVPGTHKLGIVPHVKRKYYLEIAEEHLAPYVKDAIPIELDPGDVVLFHNLLYHRGLPNRSNIIRWNADWRYQDATQSTMRKEEGHLARSRRHPERVVASREDWASREFQ